MTSTTANMNGELNTAPPVRKRACKRLDGPLTRKSEARRTAHVSKMAEKKILRSIPDTGFLPVPNRRINAAIDTAQALMLVANAAQVQAGIAQPLDPNTAREAAIREVARRLPQPRMVFDWRNGLPTKNDNPAYRNKYTGACRHRVLNDLFAA